MQRPARPIRLLRPIAAALAVTAVMPALAIDGGDTAVLNPISAALESVDEDVRIYNVHLTTLANPYMEGRVPGSAGMERAKEYIEYHFEQYGLEMPFTDASGGKTWRQPFNLGGTLEVTDAKLAGLAGGEPFSFEAESDFNVLGLGGTGDVTAPVTFVGYSIDNGPDGFSSFGDEEDLEGEIALLFRFEPMDADGRSLWSDRGAWSRRASFANKLRGVAQRGAAGAIIVNPPGADDPRIDQILEPGGGGRGNGTMPVVMMTMDAAERFLADADEEGRSLAEFRELADEGAEPVRLGGIMSIKAGLERSPIVAENVGGMIPGQGDLKDEYIVIGGHLDHLGMGYFGSRSGGGELHPGADDNASGSAGILLMAQRMSEAIAGADPDEDRRSILFIAFSGEESGLNGSRHYVREPIAPIEDHVYMMNFDMIGRIQNQRLSVSGGNTGKGMDEWLEPYFEASPLDVVVPANMSGASDHTSFFRAGIPVLFAIIADFHDDYHTPRDVEWKINRVGATHASRLFMDIALDLAVRPERPVLATDDDEDEVEAAPAAAAAPAADRPQLADIKVRFGIRPGTYVDDEDGIPVGGVTEGSSAATAGVQEGDLLVRWDGQKITDVESWMMLLARHEPGDTVKFGVKRDGEEITLEAVLQGKEDGGR